MLQPNALNRRLALVGGRLETDNVAVFDELRRLAAGRIAIIPTASEIPDEVGEEALEAFRGHGFDATLIGLYGRHRFRRAFDAGVVSRLRDYRSVFFTGGDQLRIVDTLVQDGRETPALQAIRQNLAEGGLVAGSSAGAAVMSERMILSGTSAEALIEGITQDRESPGLAFGYGLGFFPWGVVDQHFLKRGRMGRLVVAVRASGGRFGYGIDENTALFVEGSQARVCGETGVLVVDLADATFGDDGHITDARISYLDDGDGYDLHRHQAEPARDKKPIRVGKRAYVRPAPLTRNAFGSYTLHDLMIRLAKGDPARYSRDSACAHRLDGADEMRLTIERTRDHSQALTSVRDGLSRYTALGFGLHIKRGRNAAALEEDRPSGVVSTSTPRDAKLLLLGNAPLHWSRQSTQTLRPHLQSPVGIIAAGTAYSRSTARRYVEWLSGLGLDAVDLDIRAGNIERLGRSRRALEDIRAAGSYLLVGGDQQRLAETLVLRGEVTRVFDVILQEYGRGTPIIACGGAAATFGRRMIVEGSSFDALRYGASEDAGYEGMVIEEGFGLFTPGIVDQNFLKRQRLGRLLVACAEQNVRYGFGLSEQSGLVVLGGGRSLRAIGENGVLIAAIGNAQLSVSRNEFKARGIQLHWLNPGQGFDLDQGINATGPRDSAEGEHLSRLVSDLVKACGGAPGQQSAVEQAAWLNLSLSRDCPPQLRIESRRVAAGQI